MPKYMLQLENKGEFVSEHPSLQEAKDAAEERGFNVRWLDRPIGAKNSFQVVFKDDDFEHPVAVAYPHPDKPMFIWFDPKDE